LTPTGAGGIFSDMPPTLALVAAAVLLGTAALWLRTATLRRRGTISTAAQNPLTGLYRSQHLHERLVLARQRSITYDSPFALVLLAFPELGDFGRAHGEPAAAAMMRQIAEEIRREAHEHDLLAHCCNGEIAVLLLDADRDRAEAFAAAATARIARTAFDTPRPAEQVRLTAYSGVAVFPSDTDQVDRLVKRAHVALTQTTAA
jgi:diguanylate cyclase (GGDEF)-like protein